MRIFIADDSQDIRKRLSSLFSEINDVEIVGMAEDGLETIDKVLKLNPDAIILDVHLPKINGIDVLRHLRHKQVSSVIIILTNYPYPHYKRRCMEEGADYFFDKSTEFEQVKAVLETLSGSKPGTTNDHY